MDSHLQPVITLTNNVHIPDLPVLPSFNPEHLLNLTDSTGMIQHALRTMPNRKEGYCTDDNSRALMLTALAWHQGRYPEALKLMSVYLSFVHYMQTDDGYFHNFMRYDKQIIFDGSSEDAYGRTIMALGYLVAFGPAPQMMKTAEDIFLKAAPHMDNLVSLRGIANSLVGLCVFAKSQDNNSQQLELINLLADKLIAEYHRYSEDSWCWFEEVLTYDNGILPLALVHAYEITRNDSYLQTALEAIHFLETKVFHDDILYPVGNDGWASKGGDTALFDQQPLDAMAMVLFYQQAYQVTGDKHHLDRLMQSWQWFLGSNALGLPLYDEITGGCADGLQPDRVNENQGAESTIAFWISYFAVAQTLNQ
ncbi:glycosyltransferase [Chitinophaga rhizophila]|uniref:Glycosyltransferase n=1 Tax=Chitinophaga rhizophila TaxID=2866212 RepID=A0ABS7GIJ7_9BACT|nr:glycosyltransferase [Chitinophaga rhizophila]MBW8687521.1 glycosyltransferase [Chitinophaga rhizophila]